MRPVTEKSRFMKVHRGFTLVEMIIVIVITGVVVGMVAVFGKAQVDAYLDVGNRAELSDAADTALRRIARDLQSALPNSVRVTTSGTNTYLEFIPVKDAGRYRADYASSTGKDAAGNDPLDFGSTTDNTFDVLGPTVSVTAGDQLAIYNLGISGANAYAKDNLRALSTTGALSRLAYTATTQFPFPSPYGRFQVVGQPVTYQCAPSAAGGSILRYAGYGYNSAQPTSGLGTATTLVSDVAACSFNYTPGVLARNGLIALSLTLSARNESITLMHLVEVLNTP